MKKSLGFVLTVYVRCRYSLGMSTATITTGTETNEAETLLRAILRVDLLRVTVMSLDRSIARTEQAALTRKLFRSLGIKGVSVTAPSYSMAQSVDIRLPRRDDFEFDTFGDVDRDCPAAKMNHAAHAKIGAILARAFPNHEDRSDSQSDHFDFCWSIQ
jgi:hypothetical protein